MPTPPLLLAMGPVYEKFLGFLPGWTLLTALGAVLALRRIQPRLEGATAGRCEDTARFLHPPLVWRRDWLGLAGACAALLLVADCQGFFRWDDFAFIRDVRENVPLATHLNQYHYDHSLPLFRLWVPGLVACAGPAATADELAALVGRHPQGGPVGRTVAGNNLRIHPQEEIAPATRAAIPGLGRIFAAPPPPP